MPSVEGKVLIDDRGQIWPMINLINGKLKITDEAKKLFDEIATKGILYPDIVNTSNVILLLYRIIDILMISLVLLSNFQLI